MKRIILATTALTALAFAGTPASAQVPPGKFQATIGGFSEFGAGFWDSNTTNQTGHEFRNNTEVHVDAKATADNGFEYGAKIEIEANGASAASALDFDEAYIYVSGNFGRFQMGDKDGAAYTMAVYTPTVGFAQVDSDYDAFVPYAATDVLSVNDGGFLRAPNSGDSTKITYYSPVMRGFQFGLSYTPTVGNQGDSVTAGYTPGVQRYSDAVEGAATYTTDLGPVGITLGAAFSRLDGYGLASGVKPGSVTSWQSGAQIKYSNFTIGGGWVANDGLLLASPGATPVRNAGRGEDPNWRSRDGYNIGATYAVDPYGIGISWGEMSTNRGPINVFSVGGVYSLAPGLALQGDYYHTTADGLRTSTTSNSVGVETDIFIAVTRIDF